MQAHAHIQMDLNPLPQGEAAPRVKPAQGMTFRMGRGNTWQGLSLPQGAGRVVTQISAFLCVGLAWLEMHMDTLQGESEEGKKGSLQLSPAAGSPGCDQPRRALGAPELLPFVSSPRSGTCLGPASLLGTAGGR